MSEPNSIGRSEGEREICTWWERGNGGGGSSSASHVQTDGRSRSEIADV